MMEIVATNLVASQPPNADCLHRQPLVPKMLHFNNFPLSTQNYCLTCRVEKSGEHGEHAPGTPKVLPRNTQGKNLSKCVLSLVHNLVKSYCLCKRLDLSFLPYKIYSIVL